MLRGRRALIVDREVDSVVELIAHAINGNTAADRTLYPVVNECALGADGRVVVVVAELHGVAINP